VYGFSEGRYVWGRNDTIPGGPPRLANEHEDSGYLIGQVKCEGDYELAHVANAFLCHWRKTRLVMQKLEKQRIIRLVYITDLII
jgi:hypothetical protein